MRIAVLCLLGVVFFLPSSGRAVGEPVLIGTVRENYTIDLRHSNGDLVTTVAPGTYDFEIRDETLNHNFHLSGAGVDRNTEVAEAVTVTWEDVVLAAGTTYSYVCDPHSSDMYGSFTTSGGIPPPPPPPGPPPPGPLRLRRARHRLRPHPHRLLRRRLRIRIRFRCRRCGSRLRAAPSSPERGSTTAPSRGSC